jgi:2-oxoglutarate ferredoxin oxidoreductase subunit beta
MEVIELPVSEYVGPVVPDWCPGCGDFGILKGVELASSHSHVAPDDLLVVSGIGCSSNLPGFVHAYGIHGIHGRAVPLATGARLANPDLQVVVAGGDGDGYGIGLSHLIHAIRRNVDLTYVVSNNMIYGLTTGQASPTSEIGVVTKSTPEGDIEQPINPMLLALAAGCGYVARGFSGQVDHLAALIAGGIAHHGFALIDVLSPCVTFNHVNTYAYFKDRVYKLEEAGHDPSNLEGALARAQEWGERIPIGLLYEAERPTYEDLEPALKMGPPVKQPLHRPEDAAAFEALVAGLS